MTEEIDTSRWQVEMRFINSPKLLAVGKAVLDNYYEISPVKVVKNTKTNQWFIALPQVCRVTPEGKKYETAFRFLSRGAKETFETAVRQALFTELQAGLESEPEINVTITPQEAGKQKACATIEYENILSIHNVKLVEGKNGMFLSYPQNEVLRKASPEKMETVMTEAESRMEQLAGRQDLADEVKNELNSILKEMRDSRQEQKCYEPLFRPLNDLMGQYFERNVKEQYNKVVKGEPTTKEIMSRMNQSFQKQEEERKRNYELGRKTAAR